MACITVTQTGQTCALAGTSDTPPGMCRVGDARAREWRHDMRERDHLLVGRGEHSPNLHRKPGARQDRQLYCTAISVLQFS